MIKEFKEFLMQGNVLDLAVGVVIGGAFTAIVNAFVGGLITPLVLLILSFIPGLDGEKIGSMALKLNGIEFKYGSVLDAIITFVITAFVLFNVIKVVNRAQNTVKKPVEEEVEEIAPTDALLTEIRDLLASEKQNTTPDI